MIRIDRDGVGLFVRLDLEPTLPLGHLRFLDARFRAAAGGDPNLEWQPKRCTGSLLRELDHNHFPVSVIPPGTLDLGRPRPIEPLPKKPPELAPGGLLHHALEFGGRNVGVAITAKVLADSGPKGIRPQ